jgi:hypothetical protein
MSKFCIDELKDYNNKPFYYISFSEERADNAENIVEELNIPLENYIEICKENGSFKYKDLSNHEDCFRSIQKAQNALQEILEFAFYFNENNCCNCNCEEDYSDITPVFPQDFESNGEEVSDKEVNKMIQECIIKLEDNIMTDVIETGQENTIVIVHRERMCEDPSCEGFNEYYYTVTVCKDVYEYCGCPDCTSARD